LVGSSGGLISYGSCDPTANYCAGDAGTVWPRIPCVRRSRKPANWRKALAVDARGASHLGIAVVATARVTAGGGSRAASVSESRSRRCTPRPARHGAAEHGLGRNGDGRTCVAHTLGKADSVGASPACARMRGYCLNHGVRGDTGPYNRHADGEATHHRVCQCGSNNG